MNKIMLSSLEIYEDHAMVIVMRYYIHVTDCAVFRYSLTCEIDRDIKDESGQIISYENLRTIVLSTHLIHKTAKPLHME